MTLRISRLLKEENLEHFQTEKYGPYWKDRIFYELLGVQLGDYFIAELIMNETRLSIADLYYPFEEDLEEWKRVRKEFSMRCPTLYAYIFENHNIMNKTHSTEYLLNRKINANKPTYTLVYEQFKECIWKREWSDKNNQLHFDYVVFNDKNEPPKPRHFKWDESAYRFKSVTDAMSFILKRAEHPLSLDQHSRLVAYKPISKGDVFYLKTNHHDGIIFDSKDEINSEYVERGDVQCLMALRDINKNELIIYKS